MKNAGVFVTWVNNENITLYGVAFHNDQSKVFQEKGKLLIQLTDDKMKLILNENKKPVYKVTAANNVKVLGYTD